MSNNVYSVTLKKGKESKKIKVISADMYAGMDSAKRNNPGWRAVFICRSIQHKENSWKW